MLVSALLRQTSQICEEYEAARFAICEEYEARFAICEEYEAARFVQCRCWCSRRL
jgi:hypothetical protein